MAPRRLFLLTAAAALLASVGAPGALRAAGPAAALGADDPAQVLLLIGDAGKPARGGEPVLVALRRDVERDPARTTVVFLGDNVYPAGLPVEGDPERREMERRLDDQVDAVRDTGARALFIPGNHDWDKGGADGWEAVRRQQRRVEERGGGSVAYLPKDGCPGPEVVDVAEGLRLVALDTQWWLHGHGRPEHPTSSCAADSEAEVTGALHAALDGAGGRDVVVVAHHPLASGGPHGGRYGIKQHIFPLTEAKGWLWLPLPIIGSIYPLARQSGVTPQDLTSDEFKKMRDALVAAMRPRLPLAWAAGHEHALQVIESPSVGRVLVSGSGIYGHVSHVKAIEGTRFAAARSGYMRLELLRDGRRRLAVVEVEKDGSGREAYTAWLE